MKGNGVARSPLFYLSNRASYITKAVTYEDFHLSRLQTSTGYACLAPMKTETLPVTSETVRRFSCMIDASPFIDSQRSAGYFVTVEHVGKGLSGEAYRVATKEFAFIVTSRAFAVGDGATVSGWSDSEVHTVIARTAKTLTLQRDKATLLNPVGSGEKDALQFAPGGFVGHTSGVQRYEYERDENGETCVARLTKRGWQVNGSRVGSGRFEHYDFNF